MVGGSTLFEGTTEQHPTVIAAIRDIDNVDIAIEKPIEYIFLLNGDILNIKYAVKYIHKANKKAFIHIDLIDGLGRDSTAVQYIAQEVKANGLLTTRGDLIKSAKKEGLYAIQRVFILDSLSLDTAERTIKKANPDAVELLPGVIPKAISKISRDIKPILIAGGLVQTPQEVEKAIKAGAKAVSVSNQELWDMNFA